MRSSVAVVAVAFALTLGSTTAQAAGRLEARLDSGSPGKKRAAVADSNVVTLTLRNSGDDGVDVNSSYVPWVSSSGKIAGSAFVVVGRDGRQAAFIGIAYDRTADAVDEYEALAPGETKTISVDLGRSYQLVEGQAYSVKLSNAIKYLNRPKATFLAKDDVSLRSASLEADVAAVSIVAGARGKQPGL